MNVCAHRHLIGMVAVSDFHDSLYAFAFGVSPSHRKQVQTAAAGSPPCPSCRVWVSLTAHHAQGFGRRLMFAVEALAVERGFGKVSASVDSSQTRLLQHYLRLGGIVERNSESSSDILICCVPGTHSGSSNVMSLLAGITSASAPRPQTLRLIRHTDAQQAAAGVAAADGAILEQHIRRRRAQWAFITCMAAALGIGIAVKINQRTNRSFQGVRA